MDAELNPFQDADLTEAIENSMDARIDPSIVNDAQPSDCETSDLKTEPADVEMQLAHNQLQLPTLPELTVAESQYRCPGESHSISRSVHLSRLAAFYPACRDCQHRTETGALPPKTVERIQQVERRIVRQSVFQRDGVRGVFLNELSPAIAGRIASALARNIWDQIPLSGRSSQNQNTRPKPVRTGPSIVVGYDERPSSPAILATVIDSLRMMGCQVVDVGLVSKPCFCFAVDHLQASGGVFVTGSNEAASWTGLDLYSAGAMPLSMGTSLEDIERRFIEGVSRPTRQASYQRSFQATVPYEAGLWKHFHALRPLKIVVATRPRPVRKTLRRLFKKLPCQLIEVETIGVANSPIRTAVLTKRLQASVRKRGADLGVVIHDDGCRSEFFDEKARRVSQSDLCELLVRIVQANERRSSIVIDEAVSESHSDGSSQDLSLGETALRMRQNQAVFGASADDRFWFREAYPACDAVLTLARVLESLSLSDTKFSQLVK
jgi:phosphomannomutase